MTVLKSLFAYAGKYKYLTILSLVFSMISVYFIINAIYYDLESY